MQILGRQVLFSTLVDKLIDFCRMVSRSKMFNNRQALLAAYIRREPLSNRVFTTKDGFTIHLSDNPHDVVTMMVIFCRREYGQIVPGSTVLDVGANIGIFSLYAAKCGASKVFAFEPNREAFDTLCKNIVANKLEGVIIPFNVAVTAKSGEVVHIPKESSPYNRINQSVSDESFDLFDAVSTVSLKEFLRGNGVDFVDLCKMDCEGAEYDILYSLEARDFSKIKKIRLEHHAAKEKVRLIEHLAKYNYKKTFDHNIIMWFES